MLHYALKADKTKYDRMCYMVRAKAFKAYYEKVPTIMTTTRNCIETLWHLLENGRGNRVKIVWQNLVGYLDDKKLFRLKGSPALNKDFFGDGTGYTNIDKGRPSKGLMTADFKSILPLLDAYCPEK